MDAQGNIENPFDNYVSSTEYIALAQSRLLSDSDLESMVSMIGNHQPVVAPSGMPGASAAASLTTAEPVPTVVLEIPVDDYIVTNGISDVEKLLAAMPQLMGEISEEAHHSVNMELFHMAAATRELSKCEQELCKQWRTVLQQLSYRVSIGFATQKWRTVGELQAEITPVLEALSKKDQLIEKKAFLPAIAVAIIAPLVVKGVTSFTCWCIRRWQDRYTTTTTSEAPSTTPSREKMMRSSFYVTAHKYLDQVMESLAWVSMPDFSRKFEEARDKVFDYMEVISSVVLKIGKETEGKFDPKVPINLSWRILRTMSEDQSEETWPSTVKKISGLVGDIRTELLKFVLF
jgi:hypothetical protein